MNTGDHSLRTCFGSTWGIPSSRSWRHSKKGFQRLLASGRIIPEKTVLRSIYYHDDYPAAELNSTWHDTGPEVAKSYVVQTSTKIIQRCILMATDPGDLVLDPTCGSGTTAYVAEQLGHRWITIDTSRVSLALARARMMGAKFPYYILADSREGQLKEAEVRQLPPSEKVTFDRVSLGFVYERVPHITLKSIANNERIDVIHKAYQANVQSALDQLNQALSGHAIPFTVELGGRKVDSLKFNSAHKTTVLKRAESVSANALLDWVTPHESPGDWPDKAQKALKRS